MIFLLSVPTITGACGDGLMDRSNSGYSYHSRLLPFSRISRRSLLQTVAFAKTTGFKAYSTIKVKSAEI